MIEASSPTDQDAHTKRTVQKDKSNRDAVKKIKRKVGYGNEEGERNVLRRAETAVAMNDNGNGQAGETRSEMMET